MLGDRLLSCNGKDVNGMTVHEVAEVLSLSSNPCRLKLSRYENRSTHRHDYPQRPLSVDADVLFQQQKRKHDKQPSTDLSVLLKIVI